VSAVHKRRLKDDNDEDDAENEEPSTAKNLSKINKAGSISIGFSKKMKSNPQKNCVQNKKTSFFKKCIHIYIISQLAFRNSKSFFKYMGSSE